MHSDRKVILYGTLFMLLLTISIIVTRHIIFSNFFFTDDIRQEMEDFYSKKRSDAAKLDPEAYSLGFSLIRGVNFDVLNLSGLHMYDSGGSYHVALLKLKGILDQKKSPKFIFLPVTETSLNLPTSLANEPLNKIAGFLENTSFSSEFRRQFPLRTFLSVVWSLTHEKQELRYLEYSLSKIGFSRKVSSIWSECEKRWAEMLAVRQPANGSFFGRVDWFPSLACWEQKLSAVNEEFMDRAGYGNNNVEKNIEIISNIAVLCKEAGIQLFVVRMPVARELYDLISGIQTLDVLEERFKQNTELTYLNFEDLFFHTPDDRLYFTDPTHLNRAGSVVFSEALSKELIRFR